MYDIERITKIIKDIESYKREIKDMKIISLEDLDNIKLHASSMLCFSILNRIIDLGQEILVKENYPMPERYADIFNSLSKAGLMNKEEAKEINKLIDFRNIMAHTYFELNKKDVFKMLSKMNLIEEFVEKIKKKVRKK